MFRVADGSRANWGVGLVSVSRSYVVAIEDDDAATIGIVAVSTTLTEGSVAVVPGRYALFGDLWQWQQQQ